MCGAQMDGGTDKNRICEGQSALSDEVFANAKMRFDPKTGIWSRVELRKVGMPRRLSRDIVAQEIGVNKEDIKKWEVFVRSKLLCEAGEDPAELLAVGPNGPLHKDPLLKWRFRFFAESGRWRRSTASRAEVSREEVCKKVGVEIELVELWERAVMAAKSDTVQ